MTGEHAGNEVATWLSDPVAHAMLEDATRAPLMKSASPEGSWVMAHRHTGQGKIIIQEITPNEC